ncbi:MAG: GTP cyclohydrolase I FolE [Alphaproteobacteria bacterium]
MTVTEEEAQKAVRTLIKWAGDNPNREGLLGTPQRVTRAFQEFFSGYNTDPQEFLEKTFEEIGGYDELVILRNIRFTSHCEHHISPIIGIAHVAYMPDKCLVGISKLARVVDLFARRLQIQEKMTAQIADAIDKVLKPLGTAVVIEATHHCMVTRGVHKPETTMVTSRMTGIFRKDANLRNDFLSMIKGT